MARKTRKLKSKTSKKRSRTFKKGDFKSGDGMLTTVWGPSMWHYLHTMSFGYPVKPTREQKKHYRNFVLNLQNVLPCKYCRINLKNNFKAHPLKMCHMESRDKFSRYIYKLHEVVNKMLGKKSGLTYCDVRERYEHFELDAQENPKMFRFRKTRNQRKGMYRTIIWKKSQMCY